MISPNASRFKTGAGVVPPEEWLADASGIASFYYDWKGQRQEIPEDNRRALLDIMGFPVEGSGRQKLPEALSGVFHETLSSELLPSVCVVHANQDMSLRLQVPEHRLNNTFRGQLTLEGGESLPLSLIGSSLEETGRSVCDGKYLYQLSWPLPDNLPSGYHHITLKNRNLTADTLLIIAPESCFQPTYLEENKRLWGISVQLYALKTEENWGIGDLSDLKSLVRAMAGHGADIITVNPLHSLFVNQPDHCSPYSPSSRMFNNPLYIDVMAVEGAHACPELSALLDTVNFQQRLSEARNATLVDYQLVTDLKLEALGCLYRYFLSTRNTSEHLWDRFETYCRSYGEVLDNFALFETLSHHFREDEENSRGWHHWPEPYREPRSSESQAFAQKHHEDVQFYKYLQWIAEEQQELVQQEARTVGMRIGICRDLPVGLDSSGADIWNHPELYVQDCSIGAPPDQLATRGQSWGLPPLHPLTLRQSRYREFIELLEDNMTHCGALRIDHIMGLYRQWWTPMGKSADQGAYVAYPFEDLLGILKLESHRNRCMVIGEDLGIVPEAVSEALPAINCYGMHLAMFCQDAHGFFAPWQYRAQSLICFSNHDVPALKAWWECRDIDLLEELGIYQDHQIPAIQARRHQNKIALLQRLEACGELPAGVDPDNISTMGYSHELMARIHYYLAMGSARIMLIQPEDMMQETQPVNVPGTWKEYPNWQYKLPMTMDELLGQAEQVNLLKNITAIRGSGGA